jgi:hypothetical protein
LKDIYDPIFLPKGLALSAPTKARFWRRLPFIAAGSSAAISAAFFVLFRFIRPPAWIGDPDQSIDRKI